MFNNQPSIFTWKAMFVACFRSSATRVFLRAKKKAVRIWSFFTWTKSYKRGTFCGLWPNQSIFTSFNVFSPMRLWLVGYKKYLYLRLEMSEELHICLHFPHYNRFGHFCSFRFVRVKCKMTQGKKIIFSSLWVNDTYTEWFLQWWLCHV